MSKCTSGQRSVHSQTYGTMPVVGSSQTRDTPSLLWVRHQSLGSVVIRVAHCQRSFSHGPHAGYFEVATPPRPEYTTQCSRRRTVSAPECCRTSRYSRSSSAKAARFCYTQREVSPWLELTKWADYLGGHHLPTAAALITLAASSALVRTRITPFVPTGSMFTTNHALRAS